MVNGIESRISMLEWGSVSAHLQPTAIILLDALSKEIMDGSPIELFQAYIFLIAKEKQEVLLGKLRKRKKGWNKDSEIECWYDTSHVVSGEQGSGRVEVNH